MRLGPGMLRCYTPHPRSPDVAQLRPVVATDSYLVQGRLSKDDSTQDAPPFCPTHRYHNLSKKRDIVMSTLVSQPFQGLAGAIRHICVGVGDTGSP